MEGTPDAPPDSGYPVEYLAGIRLFNQGDFFEAHEAWEELWLISTGEVKRFLQGLIQCAAALHHYQLNRLGAARKTFERSRQRFEGLPEDYMSLRIPDFLLEMEAFLNPPEQTRSQDGPHRKLPSIWLGRV